MARWFYSVTRRCEAALPARGSHCLEDVVIWFAIRYGFETAVDIVNFLVATKECDSHGALRLKPIHERLKARSQIPNHARNSSLAVLKAESWTENSIDEHPEGVPASLCGHSFWERACFTGSANQEPTKRIYEKAQYGRLIAQSGSYGRRQGSPLIDALPQRCLPYESCQ